MAWADYMFWRRKSGQDTKRKSMEFPQIRSTLARSALGLKLHSIGNTGPTSARERIELVENHAVAFWCVRKIAMAAASVPWVVEDALGNPIPNHPVSQLLAAPNSNQTKSDFYIMAFSSLATTGNAYITPIDSIIEQGRTASLYVRRPDKMIIVREDADRSRVKHYQYAPGGTATQYILPERMCHVRHVWLSDEVEGFSAVGPAHEALDTYSGFARLVRKILNNSGGLPGVLAFSTKDPGGMSDEQRQEIQERLERSRFDGDKFGEIMLADVGDGDVKFVPLAGTMQGLDQKATKSESAREICLLFGVPPGLYSSDDQKFANYQEANRTFWMDTVIPAYLTPMSEALTRFFGVNIKPDLSEVPALSKLNTENMTALKQAEGILSLNEIRAKINYGPVPMGSRVITNPAAIALDTQLAKMDAMTVMTNPPELLQGILEADLQQMFAAPIGAPAAVAKALESRRTEALPPPLHIVAKSYADNRNPVDTDQLAAAVAALHRQVLAMRGDAARHITLDG